MTKTRNDIIGGGGGVEPNTAQLRINFLLIHPHMLTYVCHVFVLICHLVQQIIVFTGS